MKLIEQNPYRILGIPVNASAKELAANMSKKRLLDIGREVSFPLDIPTWLPRLSRTSAMLDKAGSDINLPQDKIQNALFGFARPSDPMGKLAYEHLLQGNTEKALELFDKSRSWESKLCVSSINLQLGYYVSALTAISIVIEDHCSDFCNSIAGQTYQCDSNTLRQQYLQVLTTDVDAYSLYKTISNSEVPQSLTESLKHLAVEILTASIDRSITAAKTVNNNDAQAQLEAGKKLMTVTKLPLAQIKEMSGSSSSQVTRICDKLAGQIFQCSVNYHKSQTIINAKVPTNNMKNSRISICICIVLFFLNGCAVKYDKLAGCHLDKIPIYGNVVKVETIMQTTMPLMELYASTFNPEHFIFPYFGNFSTEFDKHGNIIHTTGYGIDGEVLFEVGEFPNNSEVCLAPLVSVGPNEDQKINRVEFDYSMDGRVVDVKYYEGDQMIWHTKANYNSDGTIDTIIKNYCLLDIHLSNNLKLSYSDTTIYRYTLFDDNNNWLEAEVTYKARRLKRDDFFFKIKRQITYWGDKPKPRLIDELKSYNDIDKHSTHLLKIQNLDEYGTIKIPLYMVNEFDDIKNKVQERVAQKFGNVPTSLFMLRYNQEDAYATFSAQIEKDYFFEELVQAYNGFDEDLDASLKEAMEGTLASAGSLILKWFPYEYVMISGKRAMRTRYFRIGKGSIVPIYCETQTILLDSGNVLNIVYSFQSNHDDLFHTDFDNSIKSINLN